MAAAWLLLREGFIITWNATVAPASALDNLSHGQADGPGERQDQRHRGALSPQDTERIDLLKNQQ